MKDLVSVFKILNVCADRIEEYPVYIEPMCGLLHLCSMPLLKEKTSDETAYEQIAVESVAQLGESQHIGSLICLPLLFVFSFMFLCSFVSLIKFVSKYVYFL